MTKLQKFNNIIFAVFGSLGIILGLFGLFEMLKETFFNNYKNNSAVLSTEVVQKLSDKNQLRQLIDLDFPIVLDTAKGLFLFPVSQKTLSHSIQRNYKADFYENIPANSINPQITLSTKLAFGDYNNLIISEKCESNFQLIFNFKVSVHQVDYLNSPSIPALVISATEYDSNKDKVLSSEDMQELFIWNVNTGKMSKIELPNYSVLEYAYVGLIDKLIIKYGFDLNKDGKFDSEKEPTILKSYSFKTGKLETIIDSTLIEKTSNILNGFNKNK